MNSKLTPEKKQAFLDALSKECRVGKACEAVGITRQTAYNWRESDPDFEMAWLKAEKIVGSVVGDELMRRALEGENDKLLLAVARAYIPEKYNPSPKPERGPVTLNVITGVSPSDEEKMEDIVKIQKGEQTPKDDEKTRRSSDLDLDDLC